MSSNHVPTPNGPPKRGPSASAWALLLFAIVGVGVGLFVVFGGLSLLVGPDENNHDKQLAAGENAPPDSRVKTALRLIENHIGSKKPHELANEIIRDGKGWSEHAVRWTVLHQLKAFGRNAERERYVLKIVRFDSKGRPFVRRGEEGHVGQTAIALLRSGVGLDEQLETSGKQFTVRQMIAALRAREDHRSIGEDDGSYVIELLALLYRPGESWVSELGVTTSSMHHWSMMARRLPRRNEVGSFACAGLHFIYASGVMLKSAEARKDLDADDREQCNTLRLLRSKIRDEWIGPNLPKYLRLAKGGIAEYRRNPSERAAKELNSARSGIGHLLEVCFDERSAFFGAFPESELDELAVALAGLIEESFKEENRAISDEIASRGIPAGSTLTAAQMTAGDLCHAYRGLKLWSDCQSKKRPR